jgi:hypothetical protein
VLSRRLSMLSVLWAGTVAYLRGLDRRRPRWIRVPRSRRRRRHRAARTRSAGRCRRPLGTVPAPGIACVAWERRWCRTASAISSRSSTGRPRCSRRRWSRPCPGTGSVAFGDIFDEPDCLLDGRWRVVLKAEGQGEEEQDLGIGLTLDLGVERRIDREDQIALDRPELVDVAVVHEQPMVVAERVAVRLLHGAADRRADVGEEQRASLCGRRARAGSRRSTPVRCCDRRPGSRGRHTSRRRNRHRSSARRRTANADSDRPTILFPREGRLSSRGGSLSMRASGT